MESGGTYKCEVSAEAPSFRTKFAKQDMVVVIIPTKAEIVGAQPKYQVGDLVNVTCFSYRYSFYCQFWAYMAKNCQHHL
jgi:hypothetical protein